MWLAEKHTALPKFFVLLVQDAFHRGGEFSTCVEGAWLCAVDSSCLTYPANAPTLRTLKAFVVQAPASLIQVFRFLYIYIYKHGVYLNTVLVQTAYEPEIQHIVFCVLQMEGKILGLGTSFVWLSIPQPPPAARLEDFEVFLSCGSDGPPYLAKGP